MSNKNGSPLLVTASGVMYKNDEVDLSAEYYLRMEMVNKCKFSSVVYDTANSHPERIASITYSMSSGGIVILTKTYSYDPTYGDVTSVLFVFTEPDGSTTSFTKEYQYNASRQITSVTIS